MPVFNTIYKPCVFSGEVFSDPSITHPDLAYSLTELLDRYAIGMLPPLGKFDQFFDDDEEMTGAYGMRGLDISEKFQNAFDPITKSIMIRVKKSQDYQRQRAEMADHGEIYRAKNNMNLADL